MFYKSKTIVPVIRQDRGRDNEEYNSLHFNILNYPKYSLDIDLSLYKGWSYFEVDTDFWRGNGSAATDVGRFSVSMGYNLIKSASAIKIIPQLSLILERAYLTGSSGVRAYIDSAIDPNFEGPIILEAFNSTQLIPALGLDIDWNFFWRLHLHANAYYAWGHKPFQKYYFEYTYDGVQQPTAEWHSNGTGLFTTIGLGFQLWGYEKQNENEN